VHAALPQTLQNIRVRHKEDLAALPAVQRKYRARKPPLPLRAGPGALLGTEPLVRVMVEGPDEAQIHSLADNIAAAIRTAIGE